MVGKVIHGELNKNFRFNQADKYMHYPESYQENVAQKIPLLFFYTNGSSNLHQMTRSCDSKKKNQKKTNKNCRVMDFAVSADHRVKLKES